MERPMFYKHKRLSLQHQSSTNFGKIAISHSDACAEVTILVKCVHVKCHLVEANKYRIDKHLSGFLIPLDD